MVISVNMTIQNVMLVTCLAVGFFFPIRKSFSLKTGSHIRTKTSKQMREHLSTRVIHLAPLFLAFQHLSQLALYN